MAKAAILDVLNTTIGRYINNLNTQSLNLGLWSGSIELSSLSLNTEYINHEIQTKSMENPNLNIPIRVLSGSIEKISVKVPWTRITSKAVIMEIKGLHIAVEPHDATQASQPPASMELGSKSKEDAIKRAQFQKEELRKELLQRGEESRRRMNLLHQLSLLSPEQKQDEAKSEDSKESKSMTQRLVQRIIENLQIDILDVSISLSSSKVSTGLRFDSLSLYTTNENGERYFVDRDSSKDEFLRKKLILNSFGIYCDEKKEKRKLELHEYIVQMQQLSLQMRLHLSSTAPPENLSKYQVVSHLPSMTLSLSHTQLVLLHSVTSTLLTPSLSRSKPTPLFPEYRPSAPPLKGVNAKEWWIYAYRCIGRLTRKSSWNEFHLAVQKRYRYVTLYQRTVYLQSANDKEEESKAEVEAPPFIKPLSQEERSKLREIELDPSISIDGIMLWRNVSEIRYKRLETNYAEQQSKAPPTKQRRGKRSKSQISSQVAHPTLYGTTESENSLVLLNPEERKKLEELTLGSGADIIAAMKTAAAAEQKGGKEQNVLYEMSFIMSSSSIILTASSDKPILTFSTGVVTSSFLSRYDNSLECRYALQHACITDDSFVGTDVRSYFPYIMKSCLQKEETEEKAFQVVFSKNSIGDSDLQMNMVSFEISIMPHVLNHLKDFATLSTPAEEGIDIERNAALNEYIQTNATEAATLTATKISDAIQDIWDNRLATAPASRSKLSIGCHLDAPTLLFPSSIVEEDATVLVANLGCFVFEFDNDDDGGKDDEVDMRETRRNVKKWYVEQDAKKTPKSKKKKAVKSKCFANLNDMSLSFTKVSSLQEHDDAEKDMGDVLIEPVQLLFDAGIVEGSVVVDDSSAPRSTPAIERSSDEKGESTSSAMCVYGTLPNLTLLFSPSKLRRMLTLSQWWSSVLASSKRDDEHKQEMIAKDEGVPASSTMATSERTIQRGLLKDDGSTKLDVTSTTSTHIVPSADSYEKVEEVEQMHVSFSLKKLSINISNADDANDDDKEEEDTKAIATAVGNIEAHLISVTVSSTIFNTTRSVSNLTMGYFWILDNLQCSSGVETRKQRLIIHSTLPKPASLYAREENNYNILDDLKRWGMFDYDINDEENKGTVTGSALELANISLKMIPSSSRPGASPSIAIAEQHQSKVKEDLNIDLDASFTSLYVNVNTFALLDIASFGSSFSEIISSSSISAIDEFENSMATDLQNVDENAAINSSSIRSRGLLMSSLRSSSRGAFESMMDVTTKERRMGMEKKSSKDDLASSPSIRVIAKIASCEVSLRHGRTDDELFLLGMDGGSLLYQSPQDGKSMSVGFVLEGGRCEDCCLEREHTVRYIFGPLHEEKKQKEHDKNGKYFMMKLNYVKTVPRDDDNNCSLHDDVSLLFGSTQFVFSPETVANVFQFLESMESTSMSTSTNSLPTKQDLDDHDSVKSENDDKGDGKADEVLLLPDETRRKISISVDASHCRLVLVDKATSLGEGDDVDLLGDFDEDGHASQLPIMIGSSQNSESIVFQGKISMNLSVEMSEVPSKNVSSEFNLEGKDFQVYTAKGQDLHGKVQILEPQQYTLSASLQESDTRRDVDLKFATRTDVVVDISMQDISLLSGIFSSMVEAFPRDSAGAGALVGEEKFELIPLDEDELQQIQRKAAALERSGDSTVSDVSSPTGSIEYVFDDGGDNSEAKRITEIDAKIQVIKVDVETPKAVITVINDLQGLQQGLFKLIVGESGNSLKGQIDIPIMKETSSSSSATTSSNGHVTFNCDARTSLLGEYFDIHTNQWEPFLVDPWDIQTSASRKYSAQSTLRMQTVLDITMSSCIVSFSEQLLVSLGAAKRMWSTYSRAAKRYKEIVNDVGKSADGGAVASVDSVSLSPAHISSASSAAAARTLLVLPTYGVENHSGLSAYFELKGRRVSEQDGVRHPCPSGSVQYFSFVPPRGNGLGGKRAYGQDSSAFKSIQLTIEGTIVKFQHLDEEINRPARVVDLGFGRHLVIDVAKEGKATIIHIRSQVDIRNHTSLSIDVSIRTDSGCKHIGTCLGIGQKGDSEQSGSLRRPFKPLSSLLEKSVGSSKSSSSMGVPVGYLLKSADPKEDGSQYHSFVTLELSPCYPGNDRYMPTRCSFPVPSLSTLKEIAQSSSQMKTYDVTCFPRDTSEEKDSSDVSQIGESIGLQVCCKVSLHGSKEYPFVEMFLKPRALVQNSFPLSLFVRTSMPVVVRGVSKGGIKADEKVTECSLLPDDIMEVFSTDAHLSFSVKCKDIPSAGKETGWANIQSEELLLHKDKSLDKAYFGAFPSDDASSGIDFYVAEIGSSSDKPYWARQNQSEDEKEETKQSRSSKKNESSKETSVETPINEGAMKAEACRTFYIASFNTAVDHTCEILLERYKPGAKKARRGELSPTMPSYINIFSIANNDRYTMILPRSDIPLIAHKTGKAVDGARKSMPFSIDDVTLCQGTSDFSVLLLEDKSPSGYYMYKELHPKGRYELHIVHEFLVYNGDEKIPIVVSQSDGHDFSLEPGRAHPLRAAGKDDAMKLSFQFTDIDAMTDGLRVDSIGMKVIELKSRSSGAVIGKLDVETVLGKKCARFVIRVGGIKFGKDAVANELESSYEGLLVNDYLNFKLCLSRTEITIYDTEMTLGEARDFAVDRDEIYEISRDSTMPSSYSRVARIVMDEFVMDYRRFYDEKRDNATSWSLFTASLHSIHVTDCTRGTNFPDVLDSSSQASNFLTLDIKSRGSSEAGLVQVDHINLMFANIDGKAEPIVVNTSEEFMWKVLDVVNRTIAATGELAGVDASLEWDEEKGEYVVVIKDAASISSPSEDFELIPPQSQALYAMKEVKISPLSLLVSFKRQPQASRYKLNKNPMVNYFSSRLQFTIKEAELRFAGYQAHNIRGPSSQITDMIIAAYTSQLKFKIATLLSSASLQDWKYLTGRENKGDEYVEGDILRLTGNLAGKSAGFILKTTGKGIGGGFEMLASAVGGGIQATTEVFGAGFVGAGVNSVLSGVGGGLGSAIEGVGTGAGNIIFGTAKGIGTAAGGVGGGVMLMARGKVGEGASSAAQGVGQGVETVVGGAVEGVGAVGNGLFSGVKKICGGFAGKGAKETKAPKEKHDDSWTYQNLW